MFLGTQALRDLMVLSDVTETQHAASLQGLLWGFFALCLYHFDLIVKYCYIRINKSSGGV